MKTAISVPDDVFERAERLAHESGRSRSELFSTAMREYLMTHDPNDITASIDRVVAGLGQSSDGFSSEAARRTLSDVDR